jgi:riboflavin synthase
MFTGIIELLGEIKQVESSGSNTIFTLEADFGEEAIRVDQSIAHDGVCLTVTNILEAEAGHTRYKVTAVEETLRKTSLGSWQPYRKVNIERCLRVGDRLDGHFVQGHVDSTGTIRSIEDRDGSWVIHVDFPDNFSRLLVDKGSICINGVSLTVVESHKGSFSITIIPYTWDHTNFHQLAEGDTVNLEYDILGKYLLKWEADD